MLTEKPSYAEVIVYLKTNPVVGAKVRIVRELTIHETE